MYVVRFYGGAHLGKRRYDIGKDMTHAAIRSFKLHKQSKSRRSRRQQVAGSFTSLNSELSQPSVDGESVPSNGSEAEPESQDKEVTVRAIEQVPQTANQDTTRQQTGE